MMSSVLGLRLLLLMGKHLPLPPVPDLTRALESVAVDYPTDQRATFSMTFRAERGRVNPFEYALLGVTPGTVTPPVRVVLTILLGPRPEVLIDGLITSVSLNPGDGAGEPAKITVSGEDLTVLMDVEARSRELLPVIPIGQVAQVLAPYARHGILPDLRPGKVFRTYVPVKSIRLQHGTDYEFLNTSAQQSGCVFKLIPGPVPGTSRAFWGPAQFLKARARAWPRPALTTNMGTANNVTGLNFTFDGMAASEVWGATMPRKTVVGRPRKAIRLARRDAAHIMGRKTRSVHHKDLSLAASRREARALATAEASKSLDDAVSASCTVETARYGHVLEAGDIVGVRGAGLSFDGNYEVKSVKHTIQEGSYTQAVTLRREGLWPVIPWVRP